MRWLLVERGERRERTQVVQFTERPTSLGKLLQLSLGQDALTEGAELVFQLGVAHRLLEAAFGLLHEKMEDAARFQGDAHVGLMLEKAGLHLGMDAVAERRRFRSLHDGIGE